ncbi:MAG: 2-oxo acid dehydrogenase subunit E2 [Phycisphaeraceae bacterium]|nr:2-oxo acid dehydrogenase subunit E2 [Phycisphaeraceae bacterium]
MTEIRYPDSGEVPGSATVQCWRVAVGEQFDADAVLVELDGESERVHLRASQRGILKQIIAEKGFTVSLGDRLAMVDAKSAPSGKSVEPPREAVRTSPPERPRQATGPAPQAEQGSTDTSGSPPAGTQPILMPQAGNSMEEGTILSWKVAEGDEVDTGQVLCEIETDKATMEFEATEPGTIVRLVAGEGDIVPVKQPIAYLARPGTDIEQARQWARSASSVAESPTGPAVASAGDAAAPTAVQEPATASAGVAAHGDRLPISPAARSEARRRGIDLDSLVRGHGFSGSGPGGRVLSADLERLIALGRPSTGAADSAASGQVVRRTMSKMRRAIAANLVSSKQNVPHFYVRQTISASRLLAYQKRHKPGCGCTVNDCIILAVARAMMEFPAFRSRLEGSEVVEYPNANIGIAVGVPDGLVVPVTMKVERLSLAQLAAQNRQLVENARRGKVDHMGEGQFSISNMGMFGVEEFSAIINPPEAGILAVAAIRESIVVQDGAMRPDRVMTMTLSADHRIVDGMLASQFIGRLRELLENPDEELGDPA